jgi:ribulose-bisphosphate carboxylase large chain
MEHNNGAFTITYCIVSAPGDIDRIAGEIAREQTVEMPKEAIRDRRILTEIVGKVISVQETGGEEKDRFIVQIAYPAVASNFEIPQFLNLLYGNISFKPGIRITDIDFPERFLRSFRGPKFGIEGIRETLGVFGRPLVSTALKPMGSAPEELAEMCYSFALGGVDVIKDDHGLVDFPFCSFEQRVSRCMEAVDKAQQKTGKRSLYFPNVTGPYDRVMGNVERALKADVGGLLISPFLTGPDFVRCMAHNEGIQKPLMSHPSLSGNLFSCTDTGIAPAIILGKLFRLIGIDCSVYPNFGGRFTFSKETCGAIALSLTSGLRHLRSAFPTPAGGMSLERIPEIVNFYGNDIILLIGGSLYSRSANLEENARYFCEKVKLHATG